MKELLFLTIILFTVISCEDVVQIDVPSEEPRLIIDALIRVDESEPLVNAVVKVGLTSPFFGIIPITGLQQITIINLDLTSGNIIILLETTPNSGVYEKLATPAFFKEGELIFQVDYNDKLYFARTRYVLTASIDEVKQGDGFLNDKDETEVIVTFTDAPNQDNFYVFDFGFGNFFGTDDQFYQGQQFEFSYFYDKNLKPGDEVTISILGADQSFYNYMNLLIDQSNDGLNVFNTPVATVRGNIFDVTELDNIDVFDNVDIPDNFPLGYFAVVQTDKRTIVIE